MQIVLLRNVFGWGSKEPTSIRCVMNGLGTRSAYQDSFDTDLLGMPISGRHWSYLYQARRGRNGRAMYEEVLRKRFEDQDSENLHGGSRHKSASNSFETD